MFVSERMRSEVVALRALGYDGAAISASLSAEERADADAYAARLERVRAVDARPRVRVTPLGRWQVAHGGQIAQPGQSIDVPDSVAEDWFLDGLVAVFRDQACHRCDAPLLCAVPVVRDEWRRAMAAHVCAGD